MKKILFLIAIISGFYSYGQDILVGAKAGLSISGFVGDNTEHYSQLNTYHAGITTEVDFSDIFSLQVEALYSKQGAENEGTVYPADYISLPVMAKVYPSEFFSFDLGGQISYLINDEYKLTGEELQSLGLTQTDFSLVAGITYRTKIDLYFQARYLMGIFEIDDQGDWKNQVFQFSLGYNFL